MEIKIKSKSASIQSHWAFFNVSEEEYNQLYKFSNYSFFISKKVDNNHAEGCNRSYAVGNGFEDALLFIYRTHYNYYYTSFDAFKAWFFNPNKESAELHVAHFNPEKGIYE